MSKNYSRFSFNLGLFTGWLAQLLSKRNRCGRFWFDSNSRQIGAVSSAQRRYFLFICFILFGCIFILLSRESDQCAIRARLGVAGHLSTTPRWGNPVKCLSQRHKK